MPFVSITRLRVRSWLYLPIFIVQAVRAARQAKRTKGNLAVRLLKDRRNTFWTATAWANEPAMRGFMLSGVHHRIMRKLMDWCDEAAVVHWNQDSIELPTWEAAHERLQRDGRPSKVYHPSRAQAAYEFPAPAPGKAAEIRFK